MDNIYLTFSVRVRDEEYSYKSTSGNAQVDFSFPADMVESLDPGNIFKGVFKAALEDYGRKIAEEESEQEDG